MQFPLNVIVSIILMFILNYFIYRIYIKRHLILKYTISISILFIVFLIVFTGILNTMNYINMFSYGIDIFYGLISVPFLGAVLIYSVKKIQSINWYPKWSKYLILIMSILINIVVLIVGYYLFVFIFYGFAP